MNTLEFTTTQAMAMAMVDIDTVKHPLPEDADVINHDKIRGTRAYIHGDAEDIAGYDIPLIFMGDMLQLDLPQAKQDIIMHIDGKQYPITASLQSDGDVGAYYLELKQ